MEQAGVRGWGEMSVRAGMITQRRKMGSKEVPQMLGFLHRHSRGKLSEASMYVSHSTTGCVEQGRAH